MMNTCIGQPLHQLGNGGPLLANSHVDTVQLLLLIRTVIETLLVNNCVDSNGCFPIKRKYPEILLVYRIYQLKLHYQSPSQMLYPHYSHCALPLAH